MFGAWCVRARPGAQVSTPFAWDELDTIDPDAQTIATVPERVAEHGDPWDADRRATAVARAAARDVTSATSRNGLQDAPWPPVYPKMPGEPPRVAPSRAKKPAAPKKPAKKATKK